MRVRLRLFHVVDPSPPFVCRVAPFHFESNCRNGRGGDSGWERTRVVVENGRCIVSASHFDTQDTASRKGKREWKFLFFYIFESVAGSVHDRASVSRTTLQMGHTPTLTCNTRLVLPTSEWATSGGRGKPAASWSECFIAPSPLFLCVCATLLALCTHEKRPLYLGTMLPWRPSPCKSSFILFYLFFSMFYISQSPIFTHGWKAISQSVANCEKK